MSEPTSFPADEQPQSAGNDRGLGEVPEPAATTDSAAADLAEMAADIRRLEDRWLRSQAELENLRKRTRRELEDERRYAALPLLRDLLPVVDDLQRAVDAAERGTPDQSLLEGVRLVASQLESVLRQHHCTVIPAAGSPFDPHLHEAIAQVPSGDQPPGTVTAVARPGYRLHDRVIRPAQVVVTTTQVAESK